MQFGKRTKRCGMGICSVIGFPALTGAPDSCIILGGYTAVTKVMKAGKTWPDELTDAAVEIFASEENNREQRRRKREARKDKEQ